MPLKRLQERVGEEGRINTVLITHKGPAVEGAVGTKTTTDNLKPLLENKNLKAEPVKKDAIDQADQGGETFTSIFLLFGQFSVAAGVLLIFLIFVMLAAERKHELGIARAVGMRRGHLMRMFAFQGALYALLASALGSVAGVGWLMVRVIGKAFAGSDFTISFATNPQNVVIAFCLGMVLTFAVVLISSWRVSRLNVVRAIRDIPEPDNKGRSVRGILLAIATRSSVPASSGRPFRWSKRVFTCWGSRSSSSGRRSWPACCGYPSVSPSRWPGLSCSGCGSCPSRSGPVG
jgi:putative ABC transport system permease protein